LIDCTAQCKILPGSPQKRIEKLTWHPRAEFEAQQISHEKNSNGENKMKTANNKRINHNQPTRLVRGWSFTAPSLIAGVAILAFLTVASSAQITFDSATQFSTGFAARVSVDGQHAVEVHQLLSGLGTLQYRTGTIGTTGVVTWGAVHKYDTGLAPTVALSGTNVVEIHEGTGGELYYHTGQLEASGTIKWAAAIALEGGFAPSVAASGPQVIEVHQATESNPGALFCKSGQFNPDGTITFSGAAQYDNGFAPAVALAGATIVEVHQGISPSLFYHLGSVQAGGSVTFSSSAEFFDNGFAPSVSIAGPTILEAHQANSGSSPGPMFYSTGLLQSNGSVTWVSALDYQNGAAPSIAIAGPDVVEVHQGNPGALFSLAGQF
jgi:hypothetical protein